MLKIMTASERLRALAAHIVERTDIKFDMGDMSKCAWPHAKLMLGYEESQGGAVDDLAWLLKISLQDAHIIFSGNNSIGENRAEAAAMLNRMADKYEGILHSAAVA